MSNNSDPLFNQYASMDFTKAKPVSEVPALTRLQLLRTDLISTQGLKLFEAEFGAASRSDFGGAHAGRIVGWA